MSAYSSFTSKYHKWFCQMGYPELDVRFVREKGQETGEWAIIEMLNPPTIPCLTKWRDVLHGMKNIEITYGKLERMAHSIDLRRQEMWDREIGKSDRVEAEHQAAEDKRMDTINRIHQSYVRNESLMNRIAKNGLWEMDPQAILRHIPRSRF